MNALTSHVRQVRRLTPGSLSSLTSSMCVERVKCANMHVYRGGALAHLPQITRIRLKNERLRSGSSAPTKFMCAAHYPFDGPVGPRASLPLLDDLKSRAASTDEAPQPSDYLRVFLYAARRAESSARQRRPNRAPGLSTYCRPHARLMEREA